MSFLIVPKHFQMLSVTASLIWGRVGQVPLIMVTASRVTAVDGAAALNFKKPRLKVPCH